MMLIDIYKSRGIHALCLLLQIYDVITGMVVKEFPFISFGSHTPRSGQATILASPKQRNIASISSQVTLWSPHRIVHIVMVLRR